MNPSPNILDNLLEGFQIVGFDWRYLYLNDAAARHGRRPKEELVGRSMLEAYPGIEKTPMFAVLRRCMEERTPQRMENEFTFPDGSKGWFDLRFEPVPDGVFILSLDITERKRAEEARTQSERMLQAIFEGARDGILAADAETRQFVLANGAICSMLGYGRDEILKLAVKDIHPAEDLPRVLEHLQRQIRGEITLATDIPVKRKDGSVFYADINSAPVELVGRPCVIGVFRDATERRRAEARIAHLNAMLRGLRDINQLITREKRKDRLIQQACDLLVEARGFHSVVIGLTAGAGGKVIMHAGAGQKLPALREILGRGALPDCARQAMESSQIVVRINPERSCTGCPGASNPAGDRDVLAVKLQQDETTYGFMMVCLPSGMGADPAEQDLLREAAGDIAFALRGMEIEAERDKSLIALKENAEKLRIVADFAYDWEYWMDEDGSILYMSPSCEHITGYTVEEFQRDPDLVWHIVHPEDLPALRAHVEETRRTDEPRGLDYRIVTKSGGERWIGHRCVPVFCEGKRRGRRATNRDITERVTAEKRLVETEAQLRQAQKLEAIGRLAGGVAHDFNNLLTVISGYSEVLLSGMAPDDPARGPVEEIARAGDRAASLTRQLLAFSRKQAVQPVALDLNGIVSNMKRMIRRLIGEDIEVVTCLEPGLGFIQADPGQIEQVILNLVVNARDAMPYGGRLAIGTANVDLGEDCTREHLEVNPGPYVMLSVSDTGVGMDAETQSHLFEPFFTTKEVGKGTGLGLATIHGIVKQASGHIWVYSEPGKGTTFKIYFPRVERDSEPHRGERPPVTRRSGTETVLLVEDSSPVRKLAGAILAGAGYTVLEAADGEEALRLLETHPGPVHLLLTDSVLPTLSGGELALHAIARRKGIKVLFMSGHTDRILQAGAVPGKEMHLLPKPFTAESLLPKVREVLDSRASPPS